MWLLLEENLEWLVFSVCNSVSWSHLHSLLRWRLLPCCWKACVRGWGVGCPGGHVLLVGAAIPWSALRRGTLWCGVTPCGFSTFLEKGNLDWSSRGCARRRAEGRGESLEGPELGGSGSGAAVPHQGQFGPPDVWMVAACGWVTPVLSWVGDGHMAEATPCSWAAPGPRLPGLKPAS